MQTEMSSKTISRSQSYWNLALAFCLPESSTPKDLKRAYTRLFLGPGRPIAHPYESVYVEGQLLGEAAVQVAESYAEAGLRLSMSECELPDHISLELAFMAYLAAQEEEDPATADLWRQFQHNFLFEHLAHWLPQFCEKVEKSNAHLFYCNAVRAAKELVEQDMTLLSAPTVHPALTNKPGRRFPMIHLAVDISLCTLCTLCADSCRFGALTIGSTPTSLSLSFDMAQCNGCRVCLRLCPEEAITIERGSPLTVPPSSQRNVVATAQRVICPDCTHPHVAEPWLRRLADRLGGGESIHYSLALCPLCKASAAESLPIPDGLLKEASTSA